ncbi:hypothetical protein [Streptomyces rimosus]|uniref:hypothetical protein n=1 Tax=Streptomyces rimosus TaxID=1927 RepID=UPI000A739D36|nr:hypothetical protein [Streptomyces rimosus]
MSCPCSRSSSGRVRLWSALLAAVAVAASLSGCTQTGNPRSAGRTPAASAPARLWQEPSQSPSSSPEAAEPDPVPLPGAPKVPSGDLRNASWLGIVKAQAAVGVTMNNALPFDQNTTQRINRCTADRQHDRQCPLRAPQYRDLTGDGKDELIVGIEGPRDVTVWAFRSTGGRVVRILDTFARPLSIEVSGRKVILREPSGSTGYEQRTVYSWNEREQTMGMRSTEYDRLRPAASGSPSPSAPSKAPR